MVIRLVVIVILLHPEVELDVFTVGKLVIQNKSTGKDSLISRMVEVNPVKQGKDMQMWKNVKKTQMITLSWCHKRVTVRHSGGSLI